jgi:hypothetical protein
MLLMHQLHHFISNTFLYDNNLWLQLLQSVTQDLYQLLLLLNFTLQVLQTNFLSIFQKQLTWLLKLIFHISVVKTLCEYHAVYIPTHRVIFPVY